MKISLIQMNMKLGAPMFNFSHAQELIAWAAERKPDVICLPETWNVGFFPKEDLRSLSDRDGKMVRERIGRLAGQYQVNLVAGSIANFRTDSGTMRNTALVFDRSGACLAEYDKVHLFTNMGEEQSFTAGGRLCTFRLDGLLCGLILCYDLRFVEWVRKTALTGIDLLFVPAQWPESRLSHWKILNQARAIENQIFVVGVNSCGRAGSVHFGGHSTVVDPWGKVLAEAGSGEEILETEIHPEEVDAVRRTIPVFADRREELYGFSREGAGE